MSRKQWIASLGAGAGIGLIVSAVMTLLDWLLNPGGIFHDGAGTNWSIVTETALSWFAPVAGASAAIAALLLFLYSFLRGGVNRFRKKE